MPAAIALFLSKLPPLEQGQPLPDIDLVIDVLRSSKFEHDSNGIDEDGHVGSKRKQAGNDSMLGGTSSDIFHLRAQQRVKTDSGR